MLRIFRKARAKVQLFPDTASKYQKKVVILQPILRKKTYAGH
jgi:hypothetical protein